MRAKCIHRQIGFPEERQSRDAKYALTLFGKPPRATGLRLRTIQRTELVTNHLSAKRCPNPGPVGPQRWLARRAKRTKAEELQQRQDDLIREAYLRTFSRPPREDEIAIGRDHLENAQDEITGLRDLLWALLNSKEYILNH